MRLLGCISAAAAALSVLVGASPALAKEKFVYATYFSDVYSASKTDLWFMSEVEKRSGGEITFEKFWNQSLVKAPELFPALRSGAADIVDSAPASYNVREYPLANIVPPRTSSKADAVALAWNKLFPSEERNGDPPMTLSLLKKKTDGPVHAQCGQTARTTLETRKMRWNDVLTTTRQGLRCGGSGLCYRVEHSQRGGG